MLLSVTASLIGPALCSCHRTVRTSTKSHYVMGEALRMTQKQGSAGD